MQVKGTYQCVQVLMSDYFLALACYAQFSTSVYIAKSFIQMMLALFFFFANLWSDSIFKHIDVTENI